MSKVNIKMFNYLSIFKIRAYEKKLLYSFRFVYQRYFFFNWKNLSLYWKFRIYPQRDQWLPPINHILLPLTFLAFVIDSRSFFERIKFLEKKLNSFLFFFVKKAVPLSYFSFSTRTGVITVLRSPFVNKSSREQFFREFFTVAFVFFFPFSNNNRIPFLSQKSFLFSSLNKLTSVLSPGMSGRLQFYSPLFFYFKREGFSFLWKSFLIYLFFFLSFSSFYFFLLPSLRDFFFFYNFGNFNKNGNL